MLPYDASLAILLTSFYLGISTKATTRNTILVSLIAALGFYSYFAYWQLAIFLPVFSVLLKNIDYQIPVILKRVTIAGFSSLFFCISLILLSVSYSSFTGNLDSYLAVFGHNASNVNQGDFGMGWKLFIDWAIETETHLLTALLIATTLVLSRYFKTKKYPSKKFIVFFGLCLCIFLSIIVTSDIFQKFVIYGRTCKVLVPFLCIAASLSLRINSLGFLRFPIISILIISSITMTSICLIDQTKIVFPYDYETSIFNEHGNVRRGTTLPANKHLTDSKEDLVLLRRYPYLQRRPHPKYNSKLKLYNAQVLYPIGLTEEPINDRLVIHKVKHPVNSIFYQYEGITAEERNFIRKNPIEMMLTSQHSSMSTDN